MAKKSAGAEAPKTAVGAGVTEDSVALAPDKVVDDTTVTDKVGSSTSKTTKKTAKSASKKPKAVRAKVPAKKATKKVVVDEQLLEGVREQVINVADEIKASLAESIRIEYRTFVAQELRRMNRRRHWNNFFHDIVIVFFAVVAIYFGYCLYDAHYFDFMKTECERNGTCEVTEKSEEKEEQESAGPVKDATWYLANYSYLYQNLQTRLDADNIAAYYLYTDDRRVSEIKPEYLLAMAYNQVEQNLDPSVAEIRVSSEIMARAFEETFGDTTYLEQVSFQHGCLNFSYEKAAESFVAANQTCEINKTREIIEKIERVYEEGEVIYIVTNAGTYNKAERSLYRLDNLFQPIAKNVEKDDFEKYEGALNRYQYQFKKKNDKYYFSGIVKLN